MLGYPYFGKLPYVGITIGIILGFRVRGFRGLGFLGVKARP